MGNAQSPPSDPRFAEASRTFTKQELDDLWSLFISLAAQSQSNGHYITPSVFQAYFGNGGALGQRMFDLVTQERKDGMVTYEDLVIAKAEYEKGNREEIDEFIYRLCDVNGDGCLVRSDLEVVLASILGAICSSSSEDDSESCKGNVGVFLNAASFTKQTEGKDETAMSFDDFKSWCGLLPSVRKFLGTLLMPGDPGRLGSHVPELLYPDNITSNMLILKKEYAWHISGALSQNDTEEWKLLYHSAANGLSFNTFLGSVSNGGATVLVIKDKEGCIYGGYASQPWERHSDFYGDMKTFLFQLYPQASLYRPTGANNNLQWCAVNFSSDTIPNGIGFGGKANHFGLFISASFEGGHTFSCTTFDSPCLSRSSQMQPEVIECWGVSSDGTQDGNSKAVRGTVLERFKEDRNMLKMVGIANSSE